MLSFRKSVVTVLAAIMLSVLSGIPAFAQISCKDLKYGEPNYIDKMDELAKLARLPDNSWNRYHETLVSNLCAGNLTEIDKMVDSGMVKAQEAQTIGKLLDKTYTSKKRSEPGKSYAESKRKFVEMGACSACADNIAQYYSKNPDSPCGKLAKQAVDGNAEAIKELVAFPDYCKWKY